MDNSSINSAMSSILDTREDPTTVTTIKFVKVLLKSRIFLGRYVERRLVNKNIGYRDIVVVSPAEVELKKDLLEAQHKLYSLNKFPWVGITETDAINCSTPGVCLWTEIDNEPLGPFWFQIKTVQLRDHEALIKVKCLRHISDAFLEAEPILTGAVKAKDTKKSKLEISTDNMYQTFVEIKGDISNALTITNVKEFVTFVFAIIIATFTGSSAFITFLGNFILALVRETSNLIHNTTPMFLGLLDFFSKIVGGFYILLAMFFKPNTPHPNNRRKISYYEGDQQNFDSRLID